MAERIKISARRFFAFVGIAVIVNVGLFLAGQALGATYEVQAPSPVNAGLVVGMTVGQLSVGFLIAWLTTKYAPRFFGALVWSGFAFAIISAPGGWIASQDSATGIALGLMHLSGALAWLFGVKKN